MGKAPIDCQVRQVLNRAMSGTVCKQVTSYFQTLGSLTEDPAHIIHYCILSPQGSTQWAQEQSDSPAAPPVTRHPL